MPETSLAPLEQAQLLRRLSSSPIFSLASRYDLGRLLQVATKVVVADGKQGPICERGTRAQHVFVLLEGDFKIDGTVRVDLSRSGGMMIGIESILGGTYDVTVQPTARSVYLRIGIEEVAELYWRSPPFRHAMTKIDMPRDAGAVRGAAVVTFTSQFPDTPLSFLVMLLAKEVTSAFTDRILVVRPKGSGAPPAPERVSRSHPGTLDWVAADAAGLGDMLGRYDYVFVDVGAEVAWSPDIIVALVHTATPVSDPAPHFPWKLQTVLVQPAALPCARSLALVDANRQDLVTADSCRVHFNLETMRKLAPSFGPDAKLGSLDDGIRKSLGVWARALTLRRTGIAISGGGVYAMQGVYVIQKLLERGVPIDVLTATSGGALVASYYAALGLPGLDKLVRQGDDGVLDAAVTVGMVSGSAYERFLACTLGDPCIEHLSVAEFYPTMSGLVAGKGLAATAGPLALGVRAAGSSPPVFAATISSGERLTDGAFTNNLPVQALAYFNTAVTFGLNVYPPSRMPIPKWMPQCATQTLASVSILNRLATFTTALNLLASVSGRVEGDFATVGYNATSRFPLPFLVMSNFFLSSRMVEHASQSPELNEQIREFESAWRALATRGALQTVAP